MHGRTHRADPEEQSRDPSREAAIARVASAPIGSIDWAIWQSYKAAAGAIEVSPEPLSGANGDAYAQLEKKARELRRRDPALSEATAFAKAYALHPELAAAQKNEHLAATLMVVKAAPQPALNAYQILQREREAHMAKAARAAGMDRAKT